MSEQSSTLSSLVGYLGILFTILFTVYGQVVIKWQVSKIAILLESGHLTDYVVRLLFNPWVISSLLAAFMAFLSWTVALSKLDLSYAYPFTSISFILVFGLSALFFHETLNFQKIVGMILVVIGLVVTSRG